MPAARGRSNEPYAPPESRSACPTASGSTTCGYFASLFIAAGLDVKVVQARLRHASAKTTLETYGHLWQDRDDTSRAAVAADYGEHTDR